MELQDVVISASDSSRKQRAIISVQLKSSKRITGGSTIRVIAPIGFVCYQGFIEHILIPGGHELASTTIVTSRNNFIEIQLDSQDAVEKNIPFGYRSKCDNPEFTPASNVWSVEITDINGNFLDILQTYPGYDVTGQMAVNIIPDFAFKGKPNVLEIQFLPDTILNQADYENILEVRAPLNYKFPRECNYALFYTNENDLISSSMGSQALGMKFPPEGLECVGSGNETLTIKFPQGSGLLVFNYTLQVTVINAADNGLTRIWQLETKKKAEITDTLYTIVDANRAVQGFTLDSQETAAQESASVRSLNSGLFVFLLQAVTALIFPLIL
jgi:hypothetical protein